jgi:fructose-bisphosphate aldolase class I
MSHFASSYHAELIATARAMATPGKGILAADESTGTIGSRLGSIGVENTQANRQALRELLFTTPGFDERCSGVIMFEETFGQSCSDGTSFVDLLTSKNIIPGIKVDKGAVLIPGLEARGETTTAGLDGLEVRCAEFYEKGARFAKWRGVLTITDGKGPSDLCLDRNAEALASYAAICQKTGLVPIVEPEILADGAHDIETCQKVTEVVLQRVFRALHEAGVLMEGIILKPNMVTSGTDAAPRADIETVARKTIESLRRVVPPAVPGILFLSGGQTEEDATAHLNAMNNKGAKNPWTLSFSYGRALQASVLKTWRGKPENRAAAQRELFLRAEANGKASEGRL